MKQTLSRLRGVRQPDSHSACATSLGRSGVGVQGRSSHPQRTRAAREVRTWRACSPGSDLMRFIPTRVGNTTHGRSRLRTWTVHPHACGEHLRRRRPEWARGGSSPRVWGTPGSSRTSRLRTRFIPTRVGNTGWPWQRRCRCSVHPHACGEHSSLRCRAAMSVGSSPRVWGTLCTARSVTPRCRFIPTRVGNTQPARMRPSGVSGSSPRVWGTPLRRTAARYARRFIPTRVGNTTQRSTSPVSKSVHPHACGEHARLVVQAAPVVGSSPRVWGTPNAAPPSRSAARFIPTRVGNTSACSLAGAVLSVHPHACGEHGCGGSQRAARAGSSPRVWGTRLLQGNQAGDGRFIPTRVGNTAALSAIVFAECGSSPRVWGTHLGLRHLAGLRRFIPTRVGNTGAAPARRPGPSVHPHACGEHRRWREPAHAVRRFIPTRVGNTGCPTAAAPARPVHPHACGEHYLTAASTSSRYGSSPRVWGTRLRCRPG